MPIRPFISWQKQSSLTKQETEKVRREQVEVVEYRAGQPIEDWSCRVQYEHRGGISHQ
jgi:hypothetical protein